MHIYLAGRHVDLTEGLRAHVEQHLIGPIRDHNALKVTRVEIQLFADGVRATPFGCHVLVEIKGDHAINVREAQDDLYAAIDLAKDRVLRQLTELRDKMLTVRRHPHKSGFARLGRALGWIRRNRTTRPA